MLYWVAKKLSIMDKYQKMINAGNVIFVSQDKRSGKIEQVILPIEADDYFTSDEQTVLTELIKAKAI